MNRRQFTKNVGMCVAALGTAGTNSFASVNAQPQVAITIDDFNLYDTSTLSAAARNRSILDALRHHSDLKAALFVTGKYVDGKANAQALRLWNEAGHMIGNHTYSHWYYSDADFQKYTHDILRAERLLRGLPRYKFFFRFPFLKEGNTAGQRNRMRTFLKERGYRNGHVTIDASDWYVDNRLRERLKVNPTADAAPYRDFYLNHIWDRATYYDDLARKALGRSVKHTLLLHHNVLNGLFLGDILRMFTRKGWKLIDAEEAFADSVFSITPNITPAGESLVWALAKESGKFNKLLRYPAEDGTYEKPQMDALGL